MTASAHAGKVHISKDGRTATVSVSVSFLQRGGRKQILSPPGTTPWSPAPRVDSALVKAVVRAHRWRQMIESGKHACSAELAKAEKVNDSYLSRILRLTLIAPDIIEAILAGRQPRALQLDELLKPLPNVILIESKNWSNAVSSIEVNWFDTKLRNRGLDFGILISPHGITGDADDLTAAHSIVATALKERRKLVVLTTGELLALQDTDALGHLIKKKLCELAVKGTIT
jgi:hypothetical protein